MEVVENRKRPTEKAKFSMRDNRGVAVIDCIECERGRHGTEEKCSSGHHLKKGRQGCCCSGTLLSTLTLD
ncbi:MAG: hypothetical protein OEY64_03150 [Nitrospinota bacterium]|nr:hypothetical protein [Nitrospinota bacterium]